jgi:hypothetical protein
MNQFEAALLKTTKREERKARYAESVPIEQPKDEDVSVHAHVVVLKEKPSPNGTFTVSVGMPHASFTFTITKTHILSHAPKARLTQSEIRKHIIDGLKPLLGGLE